MFGLTSFSLQSALVGKTTQGWNSLLCVDLAMLKRWLSLYVAILLKFFQLNAINLPFYVTSMTLIIFVNLSRLTLEKGGFTPVLTNHKKKKKKKSLKRAFSGESQRLARQLSNHISSSMLEAHCSFLALVHEHLCYTIEFTAFHLRN